MSDRNSENLGGNWGYRAISGSEVGREGSGAANASGGPVKWGPAIAVDGKRPEFVRDQDKVDVKSDDGTRWYSDGAFGLGAGPEYIGWQYVKQIRLPADHPHYRQTEAAPIDWSGELEAIHEDGRVVAVQVAIVEDGDDLPICIFPPLTSTEGGWAKWFNRDGTRPKGSGWRIRNVPQPTPQADTKPDLTAEAADMVTVGRMTEETARAFIERVLDSATGEMTSIAVMRALGIIKPEPVDPDEDEAMQLAAEIRCGGPSVKLALAAIKRGRALALAGEKEA